MKHAKVLAAAIAVGFLSLASSGCSSRAQLSPAPSARQVSGHPGTPGTTVSGVHVTAAGERWDGPSEVLEFVTPVRVLIENHSQRPVEVRYGNFSLLSASGKRYAAVPPFRVQGTVAQPVLAPGYSPITPRFIHRGFRVAPYYAPMYPGLGRYPSAFGYDPGYYGNYGSYWARVRLPTRQIVDEALPEGVLDHDGQLDGFLYFQPVDPDDRQVTFRAALVDPGSAETFGTASIPFTVTRKQ